ncbi:MAG: hemolysin family protein [Pseudomonadota bacterium]
MSDILIILALILLNGIFAMAELALASARRLRLEEASQQGKQGARVALALADEPSSFLSTVQVGITLISIFNGAFGEASLTERLAPQLATVPLLAPYARSLALAIVIVSITFVSIVLGELVPKRIAMVYPEAAAMLVARPLQALSRLMSPFVKLLAATTELIVRLLGLQRVKDDAPTTEEISGMLREGTDAGVLEKTEYDIARRALRLDDQRLVAVMTPRLDLQFIDLADPAARNLEKIAASPYSRFPVCRADASHILGVVHAGDLLAQAIAAQSLERIDIEGAMVQPLHVPATLTATGLLGQFREHHTELALVVDEHGQTLGMVTLADLTSVIVGGVPGLQAHEPDAVQREDGSWLMDGAMALDRLRELLGTGAAFPGEDSGAFQTLAGFVLHQLGRIPQEADNFQWQGHRFEVLDMDRQRIDRVLVSAI